MLGVLEVSLSFDNAVVNASVLRHWNDFWRKLFLTVGILVAVFGMRLVFPLLIVVGRHRPRAWSTSGPWRSTPRTNIRAT